VPLIELTGKDWADDDHNRRAPTLATDPVQAKGSALVRVHFPVFQVPSPCVAGAGATCIEQQQRRADIGQHATSDERSVAGDHHHVQRHHAARAEGRQHPRDAS
jgi:hypothetical protein